MCVYIYVYMCVYICVQYICIQLCVYIKPSHFAVHLKLTLYYKWTILNLKIIIKRKIRGYWGHPPRDIRRNHPGRMLWADGKGSWQRGEPFLQEAQRWEGQAPVRLQPWVNWTSGHPTAARLVLEGDKPPHCSSQEQLSVSSRKDSYLSPDLESHFTT